MVLNRVILGAQPHNRHTTNRPVSNLAGMAELLLFQGYTALFIPEEIGYLFSMGKNSYNPFAQIDKRRFPKNERARQAKKRRLELAERASPEDPEDAEFDPADEEMLFQKAMAGVQPVGKSKGRDVAPETSAQSRGEVSPPSEQDGAELLMDLISGKVEFDLEHSDEYIQGRVKGLDSKHMVKLKAGGYSPEAHLDLHGMNSMQAWNGLTAFLKEHYLKGSRCVLLIPGRGKNSPEGYGVLREKIQEWLTRDPFKRALLAFCTAQPRHGGAGALYVLLRRKKKSQGKIVWDRMPSDPDCYD